MKAKTGRTWPEWRKALDAAGAATLGHTGLAKLVRDKFKLPGWWAQNVTVGYERMTGKRAVNQKADGFNASISKTYATSAKRMFGIFDDAKLHKKVFGRRVAFSTRTPAKTLRFKWDDTERIVIAFYQKAKDKAQVVVQHEKLARTGDVERVKKFWRNVLDKVAALAA
jgi:hypothetical protein